MTGITEDIEANERAYHRVATQLEETHPGQWVVILGGRLAAVAPTYEAALRKAGPVPEGSLSRLVRQVGEELPELVRKL